MDFWRCDHAHCPEALIPLRWSTRSRRSQLWNLRFFICWLTFFPWLLRVFTTEIDSLPPDLPPRGVIASLPSTYADYICSTSTLFTHSAALLYNDLFNCTNTLFCLFPPSADFWPVNSSKLDEWVNVTRLQAGPLICCLDTSVSHCEARGGNLFSGWNAGRRPWLPLTDLSLHGIWLCGLFCNVYTLFLWLLLFCRMCLCSSLPSPHGLNFQRSTTEF